MFMNMNSGYFQDDLNVFCYRIDDNDQNNVPLEKIDFFHESDNLHLYNIIYIEKGEFDIHHNNDIIPVGAGTIVLFNPHTECRMLRTKATGYSYISISFFPSVFGDNKGDPDFMRAFANIRDELFIMNTADFSDNCCEILLKSMFRLVEGHYGRIHMLSRTTAILSEICYYYDNNIDKSYVPSENVTVRVMKFIESHCFENINMELIEKTFFISSATIIGIVKRYTGKTFWEYVTFLRLKNAKSLLESGKISAKVAAQLSGFNYYSTFFRAYKKQFGTSPTGDYPNSKVKNWPFKE